MDLHDARTWEAYDIKGYVKVKLEAVKGFLPRDVSTILDAGCGNGTITNALDGEHDILGLDISAAALQHVSAPKLQGSITQLPFEKHSFDMCMCHEVLEHLDAHDLPLAFAELKRCAARYVMISVPHKETLSSTHVKCAACGTVFHAYGHLHRFDLEMLNANMAPAFKLKENLIFGPRQARMPDWLVRFRQRHLGQWFHPTFPLTCPKCNGQDFLRKRNLLTMASNALAWLISPRCHYWILALYERDHTHER